MIILGNKYQITKDEESKIKQEVKSIHYIDISSNEDKVIIDELKSFLEQNEIEFVVLNLEKDLSLRVKSYLEELDYEGIKIMLFSEFADQILGREIIEFNEQNLKTLQYIGHNGKKIYKRLFDIVFSITVLILLSPIFLIIAILIKVKSPNGAVIFTQQRLGLNKTFFRVFKFRTMIPNAEKVLQEMMDEDEELKNEYLRYRKLKNDPRIIPGIGEFLRKSSLDELPQFFNILIGDMSVVGPRPYIEDEFYSHDDKFLDIILSIKPGITGPWQVGERNNTTFNQRVLEDVKYISTQSFWLDMKIIFKTIKVMIFKKGAY
jgi:undecaprenyl-phosphate galactose phosphotransferase